MKQTAIFVTDLMKRVVRGARFVLPVVAVLLLAVVTVTQAGQVSRLRLLPAPPGLDGLDLGRDRSSADFPAVTVRFLTDVLGPDAAAFLTPAGPRLSPTAEASPGPPSPHDAPGVAPRPAPTATASPGSIPTLLRFPQLKIGMAADRRTVAPGDSIAYRITVTNVGQQAFRGSVQVTAHIPFGTVDTTTPCEGTLGVDPEHDCVNPPVPVPGSPDGNVHQESFSFTGTLGAEEERVLRITVRVNETTSPGTRLLNHAHLGIVGSDKPPARSGTVVVLVEGSRPPSKGTVA